MMDINLGTLEIQAERVDTKEIKPLTVTGNGVYEAEGNEGFSPVRVNVPIPSDTTATEADIIAGKTAYVGGKKVTGVFEGVDTNDATATAEDVREGKTAYVKGEKIEGVAQSSFKVFLETRGSMTYCFYAMSHLVDLEGIVAYNDTENILVFSNAYSNCSALKRVPLHDTSKGTVFSRMFNNCPVLETIPAYDLRKASNLTDMVYGGASLQNIWVKNIGISLQVGSGETWGHLLTKESLIHLIKELRQVKSSATLTVGNANLEKLANVYVRTIDITDEMRAEDDLIDEKLPFEVCESTDEGAMLIVKYAKFKNWEIQ